VCTGGGAAFEYDPDAPTLRVPGGILKIFVVHGVHRACWIECDHPSLLSIVLTPHMGKSCPRSSCRPQRSSCNGLPCGLQHPSRTKLQHPSRTKLQHPSRTKLQHPSHTKLQQPSRTSR
jgi:hypothetical protein